MKILAIDPGYERLGVAIVEKKNGKDVLVYSECFQTKSTLEMGERLRLVGEKVRSLIEEYRPGELAIETLFFSKNQKTALKVAETRGVLLYEASRGGLSIREFSPNEVKIAVTSFGKADKKQIMNMIPKLLKVEKKITHDDEYDAIAIGITSLSQRQK